MESCIYEGRVRHARSTPAVHRFQYRVFMMYLDLGELDEVFEGRWFWSARRGRSHGSGDPNILAPNLSRSTRAFAISSNPRPGRGRAARFAC